MGIGYILIPISFYFSSLMRSEAEFIEQAELARSSLQQFVAVQYFDNADELKRGALNKLMKNTVSISLMFLDFSPWSKNFL